MSFKVFAGGRSPFDDAHKSARFFVLLREDGEMVEVAFCTSKNRPQYGAWLQPSSPAWAGTGFTASSGTSLDLRFVCRVRKDSVWVRDARPVGHLNPTKDNRFAAQMARALSDAQRATFHGKEAPLVCVPGRAPARDLEYKVERFKL